MPRFRRIGAVTALALAACTESPAVAPEVVADLAAPAARGAAAPEVRVTGAGEYDILGLLVRFQIAALQEGDAAWGMFHVYADQGDGLIVAFTGRVICMAVDPVNRRAWIGGLITQNRSTDQAFRDAIHEPGDDIWFRVLDPAGSEASDRSTFVGFKGAAGFDTSPQYCAGRPWPDANARTWPVVRGGIRVGP